MKLNIDDCISEKAVNILYMIHILEKIKVEYRYLHKSDGNRESVAEHSWRLAFMIILVEPYLEQKINIQHALEMAIIHDIAESITGDMPFFLSNTTEKEKKEKSAIKQIVSSLEKDQGKKIYKLWKEYSKGATQESKLVKALDKMEAQIQKNESLNKAWRDEEKAAAMKRLDKYCDFDRFLKELKIEVRKESKKILEKISESKAIK